MHRIDYEGAKADVHGAGKPGFTVGNPVAGEQASKLGADWPNAVQEEICNAVEGAGLALDKMDNTQLWQALQAVVADDEGTWSPTFVIDADTVPQSILVSSQGRYLRRGNLVWIWGEVTINRGVSTGGGVELQSLPFAGRSDIAPRFHLIARDNVVLAEENAEPRVIQVEMVLGAALRFYKAANAHVVSLVDLPIEGLIPASSNQSLGVSGAYIAA